MPAKDKTKPLNVTKAWLENYLALEEQRKAKAREAADLEKQQAELRAQLVAWIAANGGKAKSVQRSGYLLALVKVKGQVPWKQEYIKACGAEAAEALAAKPPMRESLVIEKL